RVASDGTMRSVTLQTPEAPTAITSGPDGNIWFVGSVQGIPSGYVGRITPDGRIAEWRIPAAHSAPFGIVAGSDGALWFREQEGNAIGRIPTAGAITQFRLPALDSQPSGIANGPDGTIWFSEGQGDRLGRIDPSVPPTPFIDEYQLPRGSHPMDLAVDPF